MESQTTPRGLINNRYEILETLATGGMGNVYKALDRQTGRPVFMKILEGDHPIAPARLHRFKTEFRRTPGLLPTEAWEVYDLGLEEHGLLFLTLEHFPAAPQPESVRPPAAAGAGGALGLEVRTAWLGELGATEVLEGVALDAVLARIVTLAGAERGLIQLLDEDGRAKATHATGDLAAVSNAARTSLERVRYEREPCSLDSAGRASYGVPLMNGRQLFGVLFADGPEGPFKRAVLDEVAGDLTLVLLKDQRLHAAQEDTRHLEMLNALSRTVSSTLDRDTILKLVLGQSLEVSDAAQGAVFWGEERLATLDRMGQPVEDLRVSQSVLNQVLTEGKSLSILDTQEDERFATQASIMDLQLRSIMCVPLRAGPETRGVLYVSSQSVNRTFGPHDLEVLEAIASQVALALENAQAYQTIRELNAGLEEKVEQRTAELRATQAQLVQTEKMASLGQMVAGVAHELNNPLNFIYGNLKVLRDYMAGLMKLLAVYDQKLPSDADVSKVKDDIDYDYLAEDVEKTIESCLKGTTRSQKIVADLKLFSGHDEAELKPIDLKAGIESAIAMVQGRFTKAQFKLDLAELPLVNAYGKHLNQAFLAVLTNAGQAITSTGDVFVTLRQEGEQAVFEVRDTGAGIEPEHLPKIFDPFFTTRPVGEGTGLGLTTAFTIVERHNGQLSAHSNRGEGATFTLRLPLAGVPTTP